MTETHTTTADTEIDAADPRWHTAAALAGVTFAAATGSATADPGLITAAIAAGMGAVFLLLMAGTRPEVRHG